MERSVCYLVFVNIVYILECLLSIKTCSRSWDIKMKTWGASELKGLMALRTGYLKKPQVIEGAVLDGPTRTVSWDHDSPVLRLRG